MICWQCKTKIDIDPPVGRGATCINCSTELRCCFNCTFHDQRAHHECREPQAEWVSDKTKANFCDYFSPTSHPIMATQKTVRKDDARKKWDELFKNG